MSAVTRKRKAKQRRRRLRNGKTQPPVNPDYQWAVKTLQNGTKPNQKQMQRALDIMQKYHKGDLMKELMPGLRR